MKDNKTLLADCLKMVKSSGADLVDAVIIDGTDITLRQRLGKAETLERSESCGLGLRAMVRKNGGISQAIASSSDFTSDAIQELVERVVSMAKAAPADPYIGLVEGLESCESNGLELYDTNQPSAEWLKEAASCVESAALDVEGIKNSDGAEASFSDASVVLATSEGFVGSYRTTSTSVSVSVIAGEGDAMETDYDYTVARYSKDLRPFAEVGLKAAERAVRRLNPQRVKSCKVPLIFDKRVTRGLLGYFSGVINGASVARGTSFLKDSLGQKIFSPDITIIDDPFRVRGLGSRPFDAEGVVGQKHTLVENGTLTTWLLHTRSANQLGMQTTGHASRGISSPPGVNSTNLYMENGKLSPEEMIANIDNGFYVTESFGMGVNGVTGDYSQGASGFWIENGKITYPVTELTIAGNLKDMFLELTPANDLEFIGSTNAPTVRIDGMATAGA